MSMDGAGVQLTICTFKSPAVSPGPTADSGLAVTLKTDCWNHSERFLLQRQGHLATRLRE